MIIQLDCIDSATGEIVMDNCNNGTTSAEKTVITCDDGLVDIYSNRVDYLGNEIPLMFRKGTHSRCTARVGARGAPGRATKTWGYFNTVLLRFVLLLGRADGWKGSG